MFGRAIIFIVLSTFILAGMITHQINASNRRQTENVIALNAGHIGANLGRTGINIALNRLAADTAWREGVGTSFNPVEMRGGSVYVVAEDEHYDGKPAVRLTAFAECEGADGDMIRDTAVAWVMREYLPAQISAALTAGSDVLTGGPILIDGRDHDTSGMLIAESGVHAVHTAGQWLTPSDESLQGGTTSSPRADFAPAVWPEETSLIVQEMPMTSGTPDEVMGGEDAGFSEGTLRSIALSGIGGSQFATNPATLTYPLRGVTWVELPTDEFGDADWNHANITGSGILVVHTASGGSQIRNIRVDAGTTFTGLLIADKIGRLSGATILGAAVSLTGSSTWGTVLGSGYGSILFSRSAVGMATSSWLSTGTPGSRNRVLAWQE
jgi:hypothetical protein